MSPTALILMYHRIDEEGMDPWSLCVTPAHFEEHLAVLQKYSNPISLEKMIQEMDKGKIISRSIVVTFDDGYMNNLLYAKPLLEKYNIPATFYITTGKIGSSREFWWDELERLLLQPGQLPQELTLKIKGTIYRWNLGKAINYKMDENKKDFHLKAWESRVNTRHHLYYSVWQLLRPLLESERLILIEDIAKWADSNLQARQSHRALKEVELVELGRGELFEIGAHTVSHSLLVNLQISQQSEEIGISKEYLEKTFDRSIMSFAYPHGEYSQETINILKSVGFYSACTTRDRPVRLNCSLFELPRVQVGNWDGKTFLKKLKRWFKS